VSFIPSDIVTSRTAVSRPDVRLRQEPRHASRHLGIHRSGSKRPHLADSKVASDAAGASAFRASGYAARSRPAMALPATESRATTEISLTQVSTVPGIDESPLAQGDRRNGDPGFLPPTPPVCIPAVFALGCRPFGLVRGVLLWSRIVIEAAVWVGQYHVYGE
jgi:hypothetical protein